MVCTTPPVVPLAKGDKMRPQAAGQPERLMGQGIHPLDRKRLTILARRVSDATISRRSPGRPRQQDAKPSKAEIPLNGTEANAPIIAER